MPFPPLSHPSSLVGAAGVLLLTATPGPAQHCLRVLEYPELTSGVVGRAPSALVASDLDGGGRLDLVPTNSGSGDISLLSGSGDGTLQPQEVFEVRWSVQTRIAADVNADGPLDRVVPNPLAQVSVLLTSPDWNHDGVVDISDCYRLPALAPPRGTPALPRDRVPADPRLPAGVQEERIACHQGNDCRLSPVTWPRTLLVYKPAALRPDRRGEEAR